MLKEETTKESSQVIIRVWTSDHNILKKGIDDGCVSLELLGDQRTYISFNECSDAQIISNQLKARYNFSLNEDIKTLKRPPEFTFKFYTLDEVSILNKYKELEKLGSKREPDDSANFIWKLLLAGKIENLISKTAKVIGNIKEATRGKLHKAKGKAVAVEKTTTFLTKLPISFDKPEYNAIKSGVSLVTNVLQKCASKEMQENPIQEGFYGAAHSFQHIFHTYKNADNIINYLKIAEAEDQRRIALLSNGNSPAQSNGLKP